MLDPQSRPGFGHNSSRTSLEHHPTPGTLPHLPDFRSFTRKESEVVVGVGVTSRPRRPPVLLQTGPHPPGDPTSERSLTLHTKRRGVRRECPSPRVCLPHTVLLLSLLTSHGVPVRSFPRVKFKRPLRLSEKTGATVGKGRESDGGQVSRGSDSQSSDSVSTGPRPPADGFRTECLSPTDQRGRSRGGTVLCGSPTPTSS